MMRRPAARSARPVSVISTTQSAMSGTFASVAPYEREISASTPCSSSARRVSSGYSVLTRTRCPARSASVLNGESSATARTTRIGLAVAFEYWSWPSETTSTPRSSTQSRPVMPRSKRPLAT